MVITLSSVSELEIESKKDRACWGQVRPPSVKINEVILRLVSMCDVLGTILIFNVHLL